MHSFASSSSSVIQGYVEIPPDALVEVLTLAFFIVGIDDLYDECSVGIFGNEGAGLKFQVTEI